jgi:hypothetical protein
VSVSSFVEPLAKLDADLKQAARLIGRQQARYLTDSYYAIQEFRKASANQSRQAGEGEPFRILDWVFENTRRLEENIKRALGEFSANYRVGAWMMAITGIGPVISAGMLAHLDIRKARTAGHFWRFAGLDPTVTWGKGEKRPWNADLKTLCFKMGDCFIKFQNHDDDYYGAIFVARKEQESRNNEAGQYRGQAESVLSSKRIGKDTEAYKAYSVGKLPPAHVNARARRYAEKMFLSHLHHVMHLDYYGEPPPVPYSFEHCPGDHRHFVPLPLPFPGDFEGKRLTEMGE